MVMHSTYLIDITKLPSLIAARLRSKWCIMVMCAIVENLFCYGFFFAAYTI